MMDKYVFSPQKIIVWLCSLGIPALILCIPTTELFTTDMRLFLVITTMAILFFAFGNVNQSAVAFSLPVAYVLFGIADTATAYQPWTMTTLWMVAGSTILVNVLNSSGILERISYKIILLTGGTYRGIIFGLGILGIILNIILFGVGYVPLAAIAYGLCRTMELGKSKAAAGIFLAAAVSGLIPGICCYGVYIIMLEGFGAPVTGPMSIGWLDFTFMNLPLFLYFFLALVLVLVMFKSDRTFNTKAYFVQKAAELGPLTAKEKKAAFFIIVLLAYVISCGFTGLDSTWAFIVIPMLMFLPGIGIGTEKNFQEFDFGFILFFAGCMAVGIVAGGLGFGQLVTVLTEPLISSQPPGILIMLICLVNIVLNFLLTPMAIMAGFTPTFVQLGLNAGINPYIIYIVEACGADQIIFPYEYPLYMFFFSFGFISMKDFIKYFSAKMVLSVLVIALIAIPFWKLTGLLML